MKRQYVAAKLNDLFDDIRQAMEEELQGDAEIEPQRVLWADDYFCRSESSVVLSEIRPDQLIVLPCDAVTLMGKDGHVYISANNHYTLNSLAGFVISLLYMVGDKSKSNSHPGHRFICYSEDAVEPITKGLVALVDWLLEYGLQAYVFDVCDHASDIVKQLTQLVAVLFDDFDWLFRNEDWPLRDNQADVIASYFKWIWDLLNHVGVISKTLSRGMFVPTGKFTQVKSRGVKRTLEAVPKIHRGYFNPKRRRRIYRLGCWPHALKYPKAFFSGRFLDCFKVVWQVPEVVALCILKKLTVDEITLLQTWVVAWAEKGKVGGGLKYHIISLNQKAKKKEDKRQYVYYKITSI